MATLNPKELVSLLNIIEEELVEKNSLEKYDPSTKISHKYILPFSVYAADFINVSVAETTLK